MEPDGVAFPARPGRTVARVAYVVMGVGARRRSAHTRVAGSAGRHHVPDSRRAGAVVATVVGLRRNRPAVRWPWMIIAARARRVSRGRRCPRGVRHPRRSLRRSFARAGSHHVVGYAILGIGVLGLANVRRRGAHDVEQDAVDGVIAALAAMALAWIFLINSTLFHDQAPLPVRFLLSCYPPLSVFIVAMIAQLAFQHREAPPVVVRSPPGGGDGNARRGRRLHAPRDPCGDASSARLRRPVHALFCSVHRAGGAPSVDAPAARSLSPPTNWPRRREDWRSSRLRWPSRR